VQSVAKIMPTRAKTRKKWRPEKYECVVGKGSRSAWAAGCLPLALILGSGEGGGVNIKRNKGATERLKLARIKDLMAHSYLASKRMFDFPSSATMSEPK
jgi:hypothetical protein